MLKPELKLFDGKLSLAVDGFTPVYVDFSEGAIGYRAKHTTGRSELLFKAVGGKKNQRILDGTAGMGTDAFLLAHLGFEVTALEKNPTMFKLLQDGHSRGLDNPTLTPTLKKLNFIEADFLEFPIGDFDVVYLDPMFPEKTKSSLPKKAMQVLQLLLGDMASADSVEILERAMNYTKARIVVKRPLPAKPILVPTAAQFKGNSIRYDVYKSGISGLSLA